MTKRTRPDDVKGATDKAEKKQAVKEESESTTGRKVAAQAGARTERLEQELAAAQAEIAELKDKLLRQLAETENVRKRAKREIEDVGRYAIEKFAMGLLDVADNLERALEGEHGNAEALREGVQLTLNAWHDTMRRFNVERVDAVDQDFDPHLHEALAQVPSDVPAGRVIAQHMAGYTLHGRLLRPAKVIVSSGPVGKGGPAKDSEQKSGAETQTEPGA